MQGTHDPVQVERIETDIVRVVINRPPANAVTAKVLAKLTETFSAFASTESPPAIILTGAGDRFFCAGGDIREFASTENELVIERMRMFHAFLCELEKYPAPVVAAIKGYAVGGGLEFVLFADFVVASRSAKFGFPEINHGLLPATKGMHQAVASLGRQVARSLLYSGDLINVSAAKNAGLVQEIADNVDEAALSKARFLRSKDVELFAAIKRSTSIGRSMSDEEFCAMTIDDLKSYVAREATAHARDRFLRRKDA